jgi:hypothetical protein
MARPRVANGDDGLQMWRLGANILKDQSRKPKRAVLQTGGWVRG